MTTQTKNIKSVALVADKKNFRPALKCINFTGTKAVATDGFILAITDCEVPEQKRDCEAYQKIKKNHLVMDNGDIAEFEKLPLESDLKNTLKPTEIDCDYPPFEKVIPEEGKNNHLKIGFSVSVLEKLLKSLKANETKIFEMQFSNDPKKPVIAYSSDRAVKYVIMPALINN